MENNSFGRYCADKREMIERLEITSRSLDVKKTKNFITAIIGPRRAGKTYYLYSKSREAGRYIYINFEDIDMAGIDAKEVYRFIQSQEVDALFFDEIHALSGWQKLVNTLFESKQYFMYLSGSSSKLLSREIATELRGRALSYTILPFSFREYIHFHETQVQPLSTSLIRTLQNHLKEYCKNGGFPVVVIEPEIASQFYQDYLDVVVLKDVVERFAIDNSLAVKFLMQAALSSYGKLFSINKQYNTAQSRNMSVSKNTLYTYSSYLEEVFFFFLLKKYSNSPKAIASSQPKLYLNDVGMVTMLQSATPDWGRVYENVVFLELFRQKKDVYYYKLQPQNFEVDFVLKERKTICQLIQVTYTLTNAERELRALLHASKELNCANLLVITHDVEKRESISWFGISRTVTFVPLWKWLLNIK